MWGKKFIKDFRGRSHEFVRGQELHADRPKGSGVKKRGGGKSRLG